VSFPILISDKIFYVTVLLVIYFCDQFLWHQKFVTADVTAVFVNNQHGIQRRGQDFNKKFVFEGVHNKEVGR